MTKEKPQQPRRTAREGHTILVAPALASSCSVGGAEYAVVDGQVEVPTQHAASLEPHGFRRVDADA